MILIEMKGYFYADEVPIKTGMFIYFEYFLLNITTLHLSSGTEPA